MLIVGSFMINKIERMPKKVSQKKDLINNANRAAACLVEYVNKVRSGEKNFKSLQEMTKHMAKKVRLKTRKMTQKVVQKKKKMSTIKALISTN